MLLTTSGFMFSGGALAHDESGTSPGDCNEGDIISIRITAPEETTLWGTSECSDKAAHCAPEETKSCSRSTDGGTSSSSRITCSGSTHSDGHLHCSSSTGSSSGDDSDDRFKEEDIAQTGSEGPTIDGWIEAVSDAIDGGVMSSAVGFWGAHTGYHCHVDHCQAFEPTVTVIPPLAPFDDETIVVETPW